MLTREKRSARGAKWLAYWRGWQGSGVSVAEYAQREGFNVDTAYRWKRILRGAGEWIQAEAAPMAKRKKRVVPARFALVTVGDARPAAFA